MISKKQIEEQREMYSKPLLVGKQFAVKVLTVRNRHFGILDGVVTPGKIMVEINPGFVFGDGTHETTQMCVEQIEKHMKQGARVLDIGCGTGIQSIISALLGAGQVESVDIDPSAISVTEHNAELNSVTDKITAIVGDLTENASGVYDLVVANILADPVIELTGKLPEFVNAETTIILSGVSDARDADVSEAIKKNFTITEKESRGGWVSYVLTVGASDVEEKATEADYMDALRELGVEV